MARPTIVGFIRASQNHQLISAERVVEAPGGHGEDVERPGDLEPALARAIASGWPACVNVAIEGVAAPTFKARGPSH